MSNRYGPRIVTDGLVLCLDAADRNSYAGSGTDWKDQSGLGNDGVLTNGPTFTNTNAGLITFDGSNDHVDLGYKSSLLPTEITQEAWVYSYAHSSWAGIITNMPSWGTGFSLQIGNNQRIAAMISGDYLISTFTPSTYTWYHVLATHDASNFNALYVNGQFQRSVTRAISYTTNAVTKIGMFYTWGSLYFNGQISQVRTYNRALSANEVQQNYNATRWRFQ